MHKGCLQEATVEEYNDTSNLKETDERPRRELTVGRVLRSTTIDEDRDTLVLVPATRELLAGYLKSCGIASMHASASPLR